MEETRAVACNYRIPTKVCVRGAKAFVLSSNPGNGSDRIKVMARSRGGRWVEKYEDARYLQNFRVVTLMQCHPAFVDIARYALASDPRLAEWLEMMNGEAYYGGANSPHKVNRSVWVERGQARRAQAACAGQAGRGAMGEDDLATIENCLNCALDEARIDEADYARLEAQLARWRAIEAAARAFRQSELRLLNYRDPHYPQHEADHLAARRALREALGA